MSKISDIDLDRLEHLLRTKPFDELDNDEKRWLLTLVSEAEYYEMSKFYHSIDCMDNKTQDIEPAYTSKQRLDKIWVAKHSGSKIHQLQIPLYQTAIVALLFLFIGVGISRRIPARLETRVLRDTVRMVKYIEHPVRSAMVAVNKTSTPVVKNDFSSKPLDRKDPEKNNITSEQKTETDKQQEIAMTGTFRATKEIAGSSIESDTVLKKLMITMN